MSDGEIVEFRQNPNHIIIILMLCEKRMRYKFIFIFFLIYLLSLTKELSLIDGI